jgi:hypothetical protein
LKILDVRDHLEEQGYDKRIQNFDFKQMGCRGLNCMHVPQDRDQREAVMNTLMNLKFSERWIIFWLAE